MAVALGVSDGVAVGAGDCDGAGVGVAVVAGVADGAIVGVEVGTGVCAGVGDGVGAPATVTVTRVAGELPEMNSDEVYVKVSVPTKPALGVYVNDPSTRSINVPLVGFVATASQYRWFHVKSLAETP